MVETRAVAGEIAVTVVNASYLPNIQADERRLKQVLLNLLTNAVKFTPLGGFITVVVRTDPTKGVVIEVRDTGVGMAPGDVAEALQPFRQLDAERARKHGGTIAVESKLGIGTTVAVTLPASRMIHE